MKPAVRRRIRIGSELEIAVWQWDGEGDPLLLHHATGFCGALWEPVVEGLGEELRVVALDARGHGDSSKPDDLDAYTWDAFASDAVGVAEALVAEGVGARVRLGVGHSFGGAALLAAAAERPGLFERLLLVDPVVFVPEPNLDPERESRRHSLARAASKRRHVFASRDKARQAWTGHPFFTGWDERVFELYVQEGLREHDDGRVELRCPRRIEAAVFSNSGTLDLLGLAPRVECPVEILWASRGNFPRPVYERLAARLPHAAIRDIDAGHLIPMEQPAVVAEAIRRSLA